MRTIYIQVGEEEDSVTVAFPKEVFEKVDTKVLSKGIESIIKQYFPIIQKKKVNLENVKVQCWDRVKEPLDEDWWAL